MAQHTFICDNCGGVVNDTTFKGIHKCPDCGHDMRWDGKNIGVQQGDYNFTSHSLAMHPSQIAAHKKLFPNIEVSDDGCPQFKSVRQHSQYTDKIGMVKVTQKQRVKGKQIA